MSSWKFCRLCAAFVERHPEHLAPANRQGAELRRLLEIEDSSGISGPASARHATLPGTLLHERAVLEAGLVLPPAGGPRRRTRGRE